MGLVIAQRSCFLCESVRRWRSSLLLSILSLMSRRRISAPRKAVGFQLGHCLHWSSYQTNKRDRPTYLIWMTKPMICHS